MTHPLPTYTVPQRPPSLEPADFAAWDWPTLPALGYLRLADGNPAPRFATQVFLCADRETLFVHFLCEDHDIWGTYTERDSPIYDEEVVEIFIAPGANIPTHYYEFEFSPNGVLLDLTVHSPHGNRSDLRTDFAWNCPGIRWEAVRNDAGNQWTATVALPLAALCPDAEIPSIWRANFYRIERPHGAPPEFSCWSPTLNHPPDFHRADRFGTLHLP